MCDEMRLDKITYQPVEQRDEDLHGHPSAQGPRDGRQMRHVPRQRGR